ncbi:Uncharacterised protein [Chlamydia trachomatis]|nr:Uncharacterised protein [Chlamydia trachomatis]
MVICKNSPSSSSDQETPSSSGKQGVPPGPLPIHASIADKQAAWAVLCCKFMCQVGSVFLTRKDPGFCPQHCLNPVTSALRRQKQEEQKPRPACSTQDPAYKKEKQTSKCCDILLMI